MMDYRHLQVCQIWASLEHLFQTVWSQCFPVVQLLGCRCCHCVGATIPKRLAEVELRSAMQEVGIPRPPLCQQAMWQQLSYRQQASIGCHHQGDPTSPAQQLREARRPQAHSEPS